jgi:prophage antirepressor-like protein
MTEALSPLFEGKPIRVMEARDDLWFSLAELAEAWGMDRTAPAKIISRNPEVFEGLTWQWDVTSPPMGPVVNERGLYLMIGKISAGRLKNPAAKEAIIRFQRWVPELIQQYRKREILQVPARPHSEDVREALKVARIISEETGVSLPIAQSFALEKVGAAEWQKLLPASIMPSGYLTPTDIGNRIGKTARQVNLWLYNNKLQEQDVVSGDWRLTEAGRMHAEEFPFSRNGHSGYQIKWRDSVLQLMNVRPLPDPQAALIAG